MLTGTIRFWSRRNLCVHQTTLPTWKRNYRTWILLIFVLEREPIRNGSFTNWQTWQFLQRYSKMYPWVVKFCTTWIALEKSKCELFNFWKNYNKALQWQSLPFQSSCSAFLWQREIAGRNIQNFQHFPEQLWGRRSSKVPGCSHDGYSESGGDIFLYDIDFLDGELIGELAWRSIQKFEKSVKLLRYNNHICYVSDMNSFFKSFRCSTCDTIFSKTGNLERHSITCSERVKHTYPKNVYQIGETLFEKLDSFNIPYREDHKLLKNLAVFDFESICVKEETYKGTETTKWIGKHVPFSVSISSNLIPEPFFLCNSNPRHLVSSFIGALDGLATQTKAQMKLSFIEVETAIKIKL